MVENVNMDLVRSKAAQARIKELVEQSEKGYVDALHNVVFAQLQQKDLIEGYELESKKADYEDEKMREDAKKSFELTKKQNESTLKSNKGWMGQYEVAIPYLKSLLK